MGSIIKKILWLVALFLFSCDNSTDPAIPEKGLSEYENQYKILFRRGINFYTIHSDGTNLVQLINTDAHKQEAAWSPDELKIAFASRVPGDNMNIYIMDSNGTNPLKLSQNPDWNLNPRFAPDVARVIFSHDFHLYSVNIDGTDHIKLQTLQVSGSKAYCIHPFENKILYEAGSKNDSSYVYEFDISNASDKKLIEDFRFIWNHGL